MYVVAMICRKGGAGKTTLGVHLAIEGVRRGAKVLVIDTDQQASAARILERRGDKPPDVVTQHASMITQSLREAATAGYDLVFIDTPPQADTAPVTVAKVADLVVVPMRPSIVDVDAVQTTMDTCEVARKVPVFVLNAVSPTGPEAQDTAGVIAGRGGRVAKTTVGLRKVYSQAFTVGLGAQEVALRAIAAREIIALFTELAIPVPKPAPPVHKRTRPLVAAL